MAPIWNNTWSMTPRASSTSEANHTHNVYSSLIQTGMKSRAWGSSDKILWLKRLHTSMVTCQNTMMIRRITRFLLSNNIKMHMTVKKASTNPKRPRGSMWGDPTRLRDRSSFLRRSSLSPVALITVIMRPTSCLFLSRSHIKVFLDVKCINRPLRRLKKHWKSSRRSKIWQSFLRTPSLCPKTPKMPEIMSMKLLIKQLLKTVCQNIAIAPVQVVLSFIVSVSKTIDSVANYADASAAKTLVLNVTKWHDAWLNSKFSWEIHLHFNLKSWNNRTWWLMKANVNKQIKQIWQCKLVLKVMN